jgi:hypothetical protein
MFLMRFDMRAPATGELGPYLMHDVTAYASWNKGNDHTVSLSFVSTAEELRAENRSHRILDVDEAAGLVRAGSPLQLHPLIGGLPPEIGWRYLETAIKVVQEVQA